MKKLFSLPAAKPGRSVSVTWRHLLIIALLAVAVWRLLPLLVLVVVLVLVSERTFTFNYQGVRYQIGVEDEGDPNPGGDGA